MTDIEFSKMPNVVLIHGLMESGKSTLAQYFLDRGYERVKFAAPLKNMVRSLLADAGVDAEKIERYVEGDLKMVPIAELDNVTTSRRLMQTLGEEWRNMHSELLWVKIARSKIETLLKEGKKIVIDDNRYRFEYEGVSFFNPFKIVITRGDKHFAPITEDIHPGERPMPVRHFDFHARNDFCDIEGLHRHVESGLAAWRSYQDTLGDIVGYGQARLAA